MPEINVNVTEYNGKPAVSVKPKNVPAGTSGEAGVLIPAASKEEAEQIAKAIKAKYEKPADEFVSSKAAPEAKAPTQNPKPAETQELPASPEQKPKLDVAG